MARSHAAYHLALHVQVGAIVARSHHPTTNLHAGAAYHLTSHLQVGAIVAGSHHPTANLHAGAAYHPTSHAQNGAIVAGSDSNKHSPSGSAAGSVLSAGVANSSREGAQSAMNEHSAAALRSGATGKPPKVRVAVWGMCGSVACACGGVGNVWHVRVAV